jgi:peptidoglycan-associated lipoprotein
MVIRRPLIITAVAALAFAACHKAPPPATPAPAVTRGPNQDSIAAAARARADQARRDSIARADQMRRDQQARDDAARRAREAQAQRDRDALTEKVYFEFDQAELSSRATATLDAKVPVLKAHPAVHVRIAGNADDRGTDQYNLALGQRRAAAVQRYLEARGVSAAQLDAISFGEQRPVCSQDAEPCWGQNRRDEFEIVSGAASLSSGN